MSVEVIGLTLLFLAAGLALVFLLVRLSHASVRRRLRPIAEGLGFRHGREGVSEAPNVLVGVWKGQPIQIHYQTATRSRRARVSITLLISHPIPSGALFRRENALYRFVKAIGLTREAQAIDSAFNQRVFVESENDEVVPPLIAHAGLRREVLALLDIPRSTVELDEDGVSVTIVDRFGWRKYLAPAKVEEILSHLLELSQSASAARRRPESPPPGSPRLIGEPLALVFSDGRTLPQRLALLRHPPRLAIAIASLLCFLGPLLLLWGIRYQTVSWRLHLLGLGLAGISLDAYAPLVFAFVRGRSRSHRTFATFMFAALVGFPTFFVGGLTIVQRPLRPESAGHRRGPGPRTRPQETGASGVGCSTPRERHRLRPGHGQTLPDDIARPVASGYHLAGRPRRAVGRQIPVRLSSRRPIPGSGAQLL